MIQKIETMEAPTAVGPYSQAIIHNGTVFVSGQIPVDPSTGVIPDDVAEQTRQALTNLGKVLDAAGSGLDKTLRVTVFTTEMESFSRINEVYSEFFKEPYPSRSCVGASSLPKGVKIEIDAIAYI